MTSDLDPVDRHVGSRVRQRRGEMGLSQSALGEQIDVSFQQIQKYETGANRMSASKLWRAGQVLEVEPAYFFEGLDDEAPMPAPAGKRMSASDRQFVQDYLATPRKLRKALQVLVGGLAAHGQKD